MCGGCKWFLPKPLGKNIKDKKEKQNKKVVPKLFWRQVAESKLKYFSLRVIHHPPLRCPSQCRNSTTAKSKSQTVFSRTEESLVLKDRVESRFFGGHQSVSFRPIRKTSLSCSEESRLHSMWPCHSHRSLFLFWKTCLWSQPVSFSREGPGRQNVPSTSEAGS